MTQQDPESQRNLMLAIALSLAVLLGWQFLYAAPRAKFEAEQRQAAQQAAAAKQVPGQTVPGQVGSAPQAGTTAGATVAGKPVAAGTPPAAAPVAAIERSAALLATPRVKIETPSLAGSINLRGGLIDDLSLKQYRETISPDSGSVVLFTPATTAQPYFTEFGWLPMAGSGANVPGSDSLWVAQQGAAALSPATPVVLTFDNGQGLLFKRTFAVDDKYMFSIKDEVENKTGRETALVPYARIYRFGTPKVAGWAILHEGMLGWVGENRLQEITYADLTKEVEKNVKDNKAAEASKIFKSTQGGWVGFTDKYWSAAIIPAQDKPFDARFDMLGKSGAQPEIFWANYQASPVVVAAGQTGGVETKLFAGAKQPKLIDGYREQLKIERFDLMVDWGWFHFITKPLFWLIDWLYGVVKNFGVAILLVTVLVKGVFFPLQSKSYESMAKMKKLQPEMERLREQYKDDKQKQQTALMELYKKEKINPAAGCLPVVLQIPVFFALYKVLFVTLDMRHAPFFGWIKDLSAPDPTSVFNLFGLLPYAVPEFLHVGVWPLVMGVTMWLQMQLNPQQPDPLQQKIFSWMPVMFTFMLASFPAGLVIYWAWSNVLSLLQQYYITKKSGAEIHLWKNIGIDKWLSSK